MSPGSDIAYLDSSTRYSKATTWAGIAHISVQYPVGQDQNATEQITEVLTKIDHYLERLGTDRSRVLKVTMFISDVRYFEEVNRVWDAWVVPGRPPARTPIVGPLLRPEVFVAAEAVAAVDR